MNAAYQPNTLGRRIGADAIEERLTEIALLTRKTFPYCKWDHARDIDHPYTYRLIVQVDGREAPLTFTNRELLTYSREKRLRAIDHRMADALNKLFD